MAETQKMDPRSVNKVATPQSQPPQFTSTMEEDEYLSKKIKDLLNSESSEQANDDQTEGMEQQEL